MTIEEKTKILAAMGTKELIESLPKLTEALEKALIAQAETKTKWYPYMAPYGNDCPALKEAMASLVPPSEIEGKKTTAADRENWLLLQRRQNSEIANIISIQQSVACKVENDRIAVEIAREKLVNARAILGLREAQIKFLAS